MKRRLLRKEEDSDPMSVVSNLSGSMLFHGH